MAVSGVSTKRNEAPPRSLVPPSGQPIPITNGQKPDTIAASSSSPRQYPNDLASPILEGDETGTDSPNDHEPVTPISVRYSQEFTTLPTPDKQSFHHHHHPTTTPLATASTPSPDLTSSAAGTPRSPTKQPVADQDLVATSLSRRPTGASTSSFKRSMSNLFKRSNSNTTGPKPDMKEAKGFNMPNLEGPPPSPGSTLEMVNTSKTQTDTMPSSNDFKKNRASTGFSLRGRAIGFAHANGTAREKHSKKAALGLGARRRSFDRHSKPAIVPDEVCHPPHIERSPWAMMPDAGTGVKSRRLSISLPDDFHVETADLLSEYEYQNKLLGRHGKHLGKGATSKVTLMCRKGFPGELYAVKEFRGKSKSDTTEEYEKKVKSEYSIAKSLHHPNIVETIQLCTDHGRWNHVMEHCADGDMYQLIAKGHLKDPARATDRLCLWKQTVQGVNYLHSNGIAHRDIKLENLLIMNGSKVKITDFWCFGGICGSEPYIAPEVLQKKQSYDPRGMDVWGTAIIMIYLTFGGNIWTRAERGAAPLYDSFCKGWDKWNAKHPEPDAALSDRDYPFFEAFDLCINPPALRRLLLSMLNPDPAKRASIADIAGYRWFKNIECCQYDSYDDPAKYIDASKKNATHVNGQKKIFCHNHLPLASQGHSLGKMPGQAGY
ncbi:Serine/threonine-protein kinase HAL4/SAT4 like [Verticillium longisporum]|nr:Serine/threonine-protein kinase HAL4/SAT4 like [Verticillium longisporum]